MLSVTLREFDASMKYQEDTQLTIAILVEKREGFLELRDLLFAVFNHDAFCFESESPLLF